MWLVQYLKSMGANFGKVTDRLYRGALPKDYAKLKKLGVTLVINLIDGDQSAEQVKARGAGLEWQHIPMSDKETPDAAAVERCLAAMSDETKVVFISCIGGRHRTGIMVAAYRVIYCAFTKEEAWKEAKKFGYYSARGHKPLKEWFFNEFKAADYLGE